MAKRTTIKGNKDGVNGRNETYRVNGFKMVRSILVKQVEKGDWPGYHIYQRNQQKYIRDNPDSSRRDNVN